MSDNDDDKADAPPNRNQSEKGQVREWIGSHSPEEQRGLAKEMTFVSFAYEKYGEVCFWFKKGASGRRWTGKAGGESRSIRWYAPGER